VPALFAFPLFAFCRALCGLALASAALTLAGGAAFAQQGVFQYRWNSPPPVDAITPGDIRIALVWTGHLQSVYRGELDAAVLKAAQAWQKSKGHALTAKLPDEQMVELVSDALKEREDVGWSVLRDQTVGVAVGFPAKLVTFGPPRTEGNTLFYHGGGEVIQSLAVHLGYPNCQSLDGAYQRTTAKATFRARQDNWFVALFRRGETNAFVSVTCHPSGSVSTEMTASVDLLARHPGLFGAMSLSLRILHMPDPTIRPRPKVEDLPLAPSGFDDDQEARPQPQAKAPTKPKASPASAVDLTGKTDALKLETRTGEDLRADEVFEKAAGAVYKVKTERGLGSAVAISDSELLTNCHVVGEFDEVKIVRAKDEQAAKIVSKNADADRCVLRTTAKLPTWVTVRPYEDIKVGERAVTIGTPQGLELTVAEGIVSSKRVFNHGRVIQTSAPISQGSSGGGLFDARGHLLGITTFYFKAGQNLNFAVAAEEFAQERDEPAIR
jgi:S1-C subfamily serine protease